MTAQTVWRLAVRELRGGVSGFRIFLACLVLGVAAIAAVGSVSAALDAGLKADARSLLGGDIEISQMYRALDEPTAEWIARRSDAMTVTVQMRGMAGARGERTLVEIKGVDARYPLVGELEMEPAGGLDEALESRGGSFGAVVDAQVLSRLGASLGDRIFVGSIGVEARAVLKHEPDRRIQGVEFGPRVLLSRDALDASGLLAPGSMVRFQTKALLPDPKGASAMLEELEADHPDAGWNVRTLSDASPGARRFIDRIAQFLTLVGLTALLIGGVGVSNAVRGYLDTKTQSIATLKCIGATSAGVFATYLTQISMLAGLGIISGLVLGATAPWWVELFASSRLPVRVVTGVYPIELSIAAAFGVLTALVFTLWPLARVNAVKPSRLFRSRAAPVAERPNGYLLVVIQIALLLLVALAVLSASDRGLALSFVGTIAGTFVVLYLASTTVRSLAARVHGSRNPGLRLALANLHRPGAATTSVMLSVGLGITVLATIAMIERNLTYQIEQQLPAQAPAFFFLDIQGDQVAEFESKLHAVDGVDRIERVPMLRGRITRLKGVPVDEYEVPPDMRWIVESERGLTYRATPDEMAELVAGEWWPEDYRGDTLISFGEEQALGLGLKVGDTVTVNVLGRDVTGRIHNLRRIDWRSLSINFVMVFSPGTLDAAPHTHLATAYMSESAEEAAFDAVGDALPNVTIVRVKDAVEAAGELVASIAGGIRVAALFTLLAGVLVLAGGMLASHQRRMYDAVVLKVLGATRGRVVGAFAMEYGLLALATAVVAAAIGSLASYGVIDGFMGAAWVFQPGALAGVVTVCCVIVLGVGLVGTWRVLGQKAAPLLRNE